MRILYVSTSLIYGGAERLLVSYANLQSAEHEIYIVYLKDEPKLLPELNPNIKVYKIELSLLTVFRLRKLIKEVKPDIVHSHLGHADLIGMLACVNLKLKYYLTLHNVYFKKNWIDEVYYFFYRILLNFAVPKAKTISVSKAIRNNLSLGKLRLSESRSLLKYNGIRNIDIETTRENLRLQLNIPIDAFVLLFVGRLVPQKSVHTLLESLPLLSSSSKNIKCIIIGEGALKEKLLLQSEKLNLTEMVEFRGVTATPELYYACADLFVLPSIFEGLVTVAIESFRAGLPVIGTKIDGNTELINEGVNGMFFDSENPEQLASCINLLVDDDIKMQELRKGALQTFQMGFGLEQYNDWLLNEYQS